MTNAEERKAFEMAYDRGVEHARTEARFEEIARHFATVNGSIADTARELSQLNLQVTALAQAQAKRDAVSEALAFAVNKQSTAQITARQFALGCMALITSGAIGVAALIFG